MCTGKPENSFDLLYCYIYFIAVDWNQTCSISKVCPYVGIKYIATATQRMEENTC